MKIFISRTIDAYNKRTLLSSRASWFTMIQGTNYVSKLTQCQSWHCVSFAQDTWRGFLDKSPGNIPPHPRSVDCLALLFNNGFSPHVLHPHAKVVEEHKASCIIWWLGIEHGLELTLSHQVDQINCRNILLIPFFIHFLRLNVSWATICRRIKRGSRLSNQHGVIYPHTDLMGLDPLANLLSSFCKRQYGTVQVGTGRVC